MNKDEFIKELIFTGNIIQDDNNSVEEAESEKRFNRYIELLDSLEGDEGLDVARGLLRSMQSEQDYGAYQSTQTTLGKFPSKIYIQSLILELPLLIENNFEWAGELLCGLANSIDTEFENDINLFKEQLETAQESAQKLITKFIKEQEKDGWLEHRLGVLA